MDQPLFPLQSVLFPGGLLPLRIFEARYMDMARDCLREERPFGVCLIASGREVGTTARPEAIGCIATIGGWDMPQLGMLHVRAHGGDRFRIVESARQDDGLLRGEVEMIAADADAPIAEEHRACVDLLERIISDLSARAQSHAAQSASEAPAGAAADRTDSDIGLPFATPYRLDSSVWVGNRLCEVLPITLRAKQRLMELDDARTRLDIVTRYLRQHAVIE